MQISKYWAGITAQGLGGLKAPSDASDSIPTTHGKSAPAT